MERHENSLRRFAANCFSNSMTTTKRTQKNGDKLVVACPEMIKFYNGYMGGVDLCDQFAAVYDHERKTIKW